MDLRVATIEDKEHVVKMIMRLVDAAGYTFCTEAKIDKVATEWLTQPLGSRMVLLAEDKAMLVGAVQEHPFGEVKMASEVVWWVEPDARKSGVGKQLLEAFEYWAKLTGCKILAMSALDESVSKFYEKNNYKLYEYTYFKEI